MTTGNRGRLPAHHGGKSFGGSPPSRKRWHSDMCCKALPPRGTMLYANRNPRATSASRWASTKVRQCAGGMGGIT